MEKGYSIDASYTDFSKTFDGVNHKILVQKLQKFGICNPCLHWIKSYLTGRTQFVKFQGVISNDINVTSGVPQGSHLGPLLFNIFISDLSDNLKDFYHLFYADDFKSFHPVNSIFEFNFLQSKLLVLDDWCRVNKLDLNISKCHVITFSHKTSLTFFNYSINNQELNRVDFVMDLGFLFDKKVSFGEHLHMISSKAFKLLGFVKRRGKEFNNRRVILSLYCSLVRSILEYTCPVWNPYTTSSSNRLESIQK